MSNNASTNWVPYTIPPTPNVGSKSYGGDIKTGDPYVLSPSTGAVSTKNPSEFLEWSQLPINDILQKLESVFERIISVEERIISVEERIISVEERLASVEERLISVEERLASIEERINSATIEANCDGGNIVVTLNL
jgi:hypothetical protein